MQFRRARPDAVRAINQRWLLKFWTQHRKGGRVPCWQAVNPDDLSSMSDNLCLLDVTEEKPPRFPMRFLGTMIVRAFGTSEYRGRHLEELVPRSRREETLAPYLRAAESGVPVFTVYDVTDGAGRLVHFERLLLPFARDGETVDRILASLEFVCPDGGFDAEELMSAPDITHTLRLAATIEMQAKA